MNDKQNAIVVTTINNDTEALREISTGLTKNNLRFIVIGDRKGPEILNIKNAEFYSIDDQMKTNFELALLLPENHYARKNLGYLIAMKDAEYVIETDDDNIPYADFFKAPKKMVNGVVSSENNWCNVYKHFTNQLIWPRGIPLQFISNFNIQNLSETVEIECPVQQGLADVDPDVDAIYRLILNKPVTFDRKSSLIITEGSWCPFNSQNTKWLQKVFPLMYLPSYCSFRMTDIWRSFVAQNWILSQGMGVSFSNASVLQKRNFHDLEKDFIDEIPGYINNHNIRLELLKIDTDIGMLDYLIKAYQKLSEIGVVDKKEMPLVKAWCKDVSRVWE